MLGSSIDVRRDDRHLSGRGATARIVAQLRFPALPRAFVQGKIGAPLQAPLESSPAESAGSWCYHEHMSTAGNKARHSLP
ncbi:MAG: hypothetical protein D4R74_09140 [Betaproteobacteria bacterium]|nr:MAG: hypothetical protein D4R74_09140 [Betaproteobacteria bacterium]